MTGRQVGVTPPPEKLDAYLDLSNDDVERIVLCLMVEEALRRRLAVYRLEDLAAEPVEGQEELIVVRADIMSVSDALR
jgi:hypothetical protein